jgi:hypothetical protein
MIKTSKILTVTVASVIMATTPASIAMARGDSSGSGSSSDNSISNSVSNSTAETESQTSTSPQTSTETEKHAKDLVEKFKKTVQEQKDTSKTDVRQKSTEARQKSCEARKNSLQTRMQNKVAAATKHKEVFDKIFLKVKTFHDQKALNTPNYDQLVAAAEAAQTEVANQISALSSLDVSIDCTQVNVADSVSAFRESLKSTRQALKAYQTAIKDLVVAVHQSNETNQ